jgi:hypothetical protein
VVSDTVPCSLDGITYSQLDEGDYTFQMQGLSSDGAQLYTSGATITVNNGTNDFSVNLSPAK